MSLELLKVYPSEVEIVMNCWQLNVSYLLFELFSSYVDKGTIIKLLVGSADNSNRVRRLVLDGHFELFTISHSQVLR